MTGFRRLLQRLWVIFLRGSGCLWWAKRQLRREGATVVLMFHRVLDEADWERTNSLRGIVVRSRTFERLAAYLARRCETVELSEAGPGAVGPKIRIALTFDDAWRDNYTTGLPILLAEGLPATVFVCTGLTGRVAPFWPEKVMQSLRAMRPATPEPEAEVLIEHLKTYAPRAREEWIEGLAETLGAEEARGRAFEGDSTMSWEEIEEMDRAGVTFGSHTHTHQILPGVGLDVARRELRESRAELERKLGKRCELFAYPNGTWSAEARRVVEEEGFRQAFIGRRSAWTADDDPFLIPRSNVCESNMVDLAGRFSPAMFEYTSFWKVWLAMRKKARPRAAAKWRRAERTVGVNLS